MHSAYFHHLFTPEGVTVVIIPLILHFNPP
jgi:hypothetical protein